MVGACYLEKGTKTFIVTSEGEQFFTDFGLDLPALRKKRRSFARVCLDRSERHHHLAGSLGEGLAQRLFELEWIIRIPSTRAVKITEKGQSMLKKEFQLAI